MKSDKTLIKSDSLDYEEFNVIIELYKTKFSGGYGDRRSSIYSIELIFKDKISKDTHSVTKMTSVNNIREISKAKYSKKLDSIIYIELKDSILKTYGIKKYA